MTDNEKKLEIEKDIKDREDLINKYKAKGCFSKHEKDEAIKKVMELRASDEVVNAIALAENAVNSVPPEQATDEMVFNEINKQIEFLNAKLANEFGRN